jgi:GT2 family glycosyltransferase
LKIKGILYSIRPLRKLYYRLKSRPVENRVMENVALHGSCYICSGSFIKNRDHALNPGTFMYCESQILDYECMRDGMLTIYCPSVRILHHEDVATDAAGGSYEEKLLKKCDRVLESLYYMKDMMLKDSGEI